MVFTTLLFRSGLSAKERVRANGLVATGYRATSTEQARMVDRAGWTLIEQCDATAEYAETVRRDLRAHESRAVRAARILGEVELDARMERKQKYLQGIEEGLLRRALFVADVRD